MSLLYPAKIHHVKSYLFSCVPWLFTPLPPSYAPVLEPASNTAVATSSPPEASWIVLNNLGASWIILDPFGASWILLEPFGYH